MMYDKDDDGFDDDRFDDDEFDDGDDDGYDNDGDDYDSQPRICLQSLRGHVGDEGCIRGVQGLSVCVYVVEVENKAKK
jgi:hypothetical protein